MGVLSVCFPRMRTGKVAPEACDSAATLEECDAGTAVQPLALILQPSPSGKLRGSADAPGDATNGACAEEQQNVQEELEGGKAALRQEHVVSMRSAKSFKSMDELRDSIHEQDSQPLKRGSEDGDDDDVDRARPSTRLGRKGGVSFKASVAVKEFTTDAPAAVIKPQSSTPAAGAEKDLSEARTSMRSLKSFASMSDLQKRITAPKLKSALVTRPSSARTADAGTTALRSTHSHEHATVSRLSTTHSASDTTAARTRSISGPGSVAAAAAQTPVPVRKEMRPLGLDSGSGMLRSLHKPSRSMGSLTPLSLSSSPRQSWSKGPLSPLGQVSPMGQFSSFGQFSPLGQASPMCQVSPLGQVNQMGQVITLGQVTAVGSVSPLGQVTPMAATNTALRVSVSPSALNPGVWGGSGASVSPSTQYASGMIVSPFPADPGVWRGGLGSPVAQFMPAPWAGGAVARNTAAWGNIMGSSSSAAMLGNMALPGASVLVEDGGSGWESGVGDVTAWVKSSQAQTAGNAMG